MSNYDNEEIKVVSTLKETDRKCPDCGGVMDFNPTTGGLRCPYCDHEEAIPSDSAKPQKAEEMDYFAAEKTANCDWGVEKKTVLCKSCGAESIYDSLQIASECPFCGSNQVMEASSLETMAPGGVVPFRITDKDAADLFLKWIRKKWFCPKVAKESAKPKKFLGSYLPYWTFDTDTTSEYSAKYGKDRHVRDKEGKTKIITDWYNTSGTYQERINDELIIASSTHDASILQGLEPFDTENNKAYKPEYVAGFAAQRYSVGLKQAWETAKQKILGKLQNNISDKVRHEKNADHVTNVSVSTTYRNITFKYLLLPIWAAHYKYKDKIYHFMVNGQTGKVSGKTPISVWKVLLTILMAVAVFGAIYYINNYVL